MVSSCDYLKAKEVPRRVHRASLGFDDDVNWVDNNLNEVADVIESLQQQARRYREEDFD